MKKKLAEAKRAKNIAEWAKDEALRAKDSVESGLASAQKQAEDQIGRLLEAEEQL